MGWDEVWHLAMKHFAAEPIELRILIGLGCAFALLMIVIGLRHAFRPAGPVFEPRLPDPVRPVVLAIAPSPQPVVLKTTTVAPTPRSPRQPFRPRPRVARVVAKPIKDAAKPFRPMRPQIRRAALRHFGQ